MKRVTKTCQYCGSEMKVSDGAYEENPFCAECLPERIKKAAQETCPGRWETDDDGYYVMWISDKN